MPVLPLFPRPLACSLLLAATVASATQPVNASLRDTRWSLRALDGSAVAQPSNGEQVHLQFKAGSQHLAGFGGCNRLAGRLTQRGTELALSARAATRKACAPPQVQTEARLLRALGGIDAYRVEGEVLSLMQGGTVRATFAVASGPP